MRLLFIYFYETKGTFKKGTIISLSKKYSVTHNGDFNFTLEKNDLFQDDFYGESIDIGAIIGENGTGKSVLINSLRDRDNDYSLAVYEKDEKLFYQGDISGLNKKIKNIRWRVSHSPLKLRDFQYQFNFSKNFYSKLYINNNLLKSVHNISFVYYSPILDKFSEDSKELINISDKQLLLNNDNTDLEKNLLLVENRDLQNLFVMSNVTDKVNVKRVKLDISQSYFKNIENVFIEWIKKNDNIFKICEKILTINIDNNNETKLIDIMLKLIHPLRIGWFLKDNLTQDTYKIIQFLIDEKLSEKYFNILDKEIKKRFFSSITENEANLIINQSKIFFEQDFDNYNDRIHTQNSFTGRFDFLDGSFNTSSIYEEEIRNLIQKKILNNFIKKSRKNKSFFDYIDMSEFLYYSYINKLFESELVPNNQLLFYSLMSKKINWDYLNKRNQTETLALNKIRYFVYKYLNNDYISIFANHFNTHDNALIFLYNF